MTTTPEKIPHVSSNGTSPKNKSSPHKNGPIGIFDMMSSYEVEPGVRANSICRNFGGKLIDQHGTWPDIHSFWHAFLNGLELSRNSNCLGRREGDQYTWMNYQEVYDKVEALATAFSMQEDMKRQDCVGIYSISNCEWVIAALAIGSRAMVIVPLYDTLGADACSHIINDTNMQYLFIDTEVAANRILSRVNETPSLRHIIMFKKPSDSLLAQATDAKVNVLTLDQFIERFNKVPEKSAFSPADRDETCITMYTSGTTGLPKGVVLTHKAVVYDVLGIDGCMRQEGWDPNYQVSEKDVILQFLPLAHAYGLAVVLWGLLRGASVGFFGGNILKLTEDASILKPTFMPLVPRLMNRIYGQVVGQLQHGGIKAKLFWYAYRRKREAFLQGVITRDSFWDKLVFRRIQNLLGGRVWFFSVGSAPISAEVLEFWRVVFGAFVLEGYGQTETSACASLAFSRVGGNIGHPLPCNYIRLADVPECDYHVKDGKGEICIKGINTMEHYHNLPEKTEEAMDSDGWIHTGDIGEFLEDGSLRIIDRKKNIFKLAQGEYIAPEKIENIYLLCPEIGQIFVDGKTIESFIIAVIVPEIGLVKEYASEHHLEVDDVYKNDDYRKHLLKRLMAIGKENKLNSLEQVKNIYICPESFSSDNGLLTPTMKNKRPEMRKHFQEQIDNMYKEGPLKLE